MVIYKITGTSMTCTCKNYLAESRQAYTNCRPLARTPVDLVRNQCPNYNILWTWQQCFNNTQTCEWHHGSHILPWLQAVQQALTRTKHQFVQRTWCQDSRILPFAKRFPTYKKLEKNFRCSSFRLLWHLWMILKISHVNHKNLPVLPT